MKRIWLAVSLVFVFSANGPAWSSEDGAKLFKKHCGACHTINKGGKKRQGPNLWGLFDRPMGSVDKFPYSKKLKASTDNWTPELLDKWLEKPKQVFSDTYMIYKQANPDIRAQLVKYVQEASKE